MITSRASPPPVLIVGAVVSGNATESEIPLHAAILQSRSGSLRATAPLPRQQVTDWQCVIPQDGVVAILRDNRSGGRRHIACAGLPNAGHPVDSAGEATTACHDSTDNSREAGPSSMSIDLERAEQLLPLHQGGEPSIVYSTLAHRPTTLCVRHPAKSEACSLQEWRPRWSRRRAVGAEGGGVNSLIRLACALLLLAAWQPAYADGVFRGSFEHEGFTPLQFATVELRNSAGVVKATASTDVWRAFTPFAASQIDAGDSLVAYGGVLGGAPFAGELRLLMDGTVALQSVGVITTLVTAVADSDLVQGATPAQRLANAVALLQSLGLIDAQWREGSPARVVYPIEPGIVAAGGVQNWVTLLLGQIQSGQIDDPWMETFPFANGGVFGIEVDTEAMSWLPGDEGSARLSVRSTLASPPVWGLDLQGAPAWMSLDSDGLLSFDIPPGVAPGVITLTVRVDNPVVGIGRTLSLPFRVEGGAVVAELSVGASGGELWHPNGTVGMRLPVGAVVESTVLQWVDYADEDGEIRSLLRTLPRDRVFLQSTQLLFGELPDPQRAVSGAACSGFTPEPSWALALCGEAYFASVAARLPGIVEYPVVGMNRVPPANGGFPPGSIYRPTTKRQISFTLSSLCHGACSIANKEPVIFVHGYTAKGKIGGGRDTWGDLPKLVQALEGGSAFAVYEFRYRSNARFEDIATDLNEAVRAAYNATGQRKVHIVAHSFGGLVARRLVQVSQAVPQGPLQGGCSAHPNEHVASLLTLGTPHSGVSHQEVQFSSIRFPVGVHGIVGAGIRHVCGQLSCWQAGSDGLFGSGDGREALLWFYRVGAPAGEMIHQLSDFGFSPLTVPTLSLAGMVNRTGRPDESASYSGGDELISYQGQRFSPRLSCNGGTCLNTPIGSSPLTSIGGVPLGDCVFEQVLGAPRSNAQPVPGNRIGVGPSVARAYRHSAVVPPVAMAAESLVAERDHMPGRAPLAYHEGSVHDAFNRVRSWLVAGEVEPLERNVSVSVLGAGRVEVLSGATTHVCEAANPQSSTPTECLFQTQAQSFVKYVPAPGAQPQFRSPFCDSPDGCGMLVGAYQRVSARFTPSNLAALNLQILGVGRVDTNGGQSCSGNCTFYFVPSSPLILTRHVLPGGTWNQWSGACSGSGEQCQITLGAAGSWRSVTASFTAGAPVTIGTGRLNDTGQDWCAANTTGGLTCPQSGFPDQDGDHGRDALAQAGQLVKVGGGEAGFDFTKISNSGNALPANVALGSGPNDWACTRDNVTGLIWEVKVNNATHLRHMNHTYSWYSTDASINGGVPGSLGTAVTCNSTLPQCNTQAYVEAVNTQELCGHNNWRMPRPDELQGIVHYGRLNPAVDPVYFVNTPINYNEVVLSAARSRASFASDAWYVDFNAGGSFVFSKFGDAGVRLVRAGQ